MKPFFLTCYFTLRETDLMKCSFNNKGCAAERLQVLSHCWWCVISFCALLLAVFYLLHVDISWLEQYVAKEPLGKSFVGVRRVPVAREVRVRSEADAALTDELLRYYFRAVMKVDVTVHQRDGVMDVEFLSAQCEFALLCSEKSLKSLMAVKYPWSDERMSVVCWQCEHQKC